MSSPIGLGREMQDSAVMPAKRMRLPMGMRSRRAFHVAAALAGLGLSLPRDADACGACYASSSESTIVSDHQMALAISKQQTVLWDQIQYTGNPKDFAYVLPAKPGTRLEPSNESWFGALEASTRPIIMAPQFGGGYSGGGGDYESSGGCCTSSDDAMLGSPSAGGAGSPGEAVQVIEQAVVGPYETVTLRSEDPEALQKWLVAHGYAIPEISGPIIASYVQSGFDFIALRLQPSQNERKIEPIRIVSPGADLSLPLRLMQIGSGAKVGITLYVIGEGRYRTKNFPEGQVNFAKLMWDYSQNRSNYQELLAQGMATENGRAFVTEYANKPGLDPNAPLLQPGFTMGNPPLAAAYKQSCPTFGQPRPDPGSDEEEDAGLDAATDEDAGDASLADAGDAGDDAGGEDASSGEATGDAGKPPKVRPTVCDDLEVALEGLNRNDVWVTRLRANLPNAALADTLQLEPNLAQVPFDNVHQTQTTGTITASVAPRRVRWQHGTYALIAGTAFVVSRMIRRKKR
jgi:Uncharacterized protein conserved in bacteria (DUF2330)